MKEHTPDFFPDTFLSHFQTFQGRFQTLAWHHHLKLTTAELPRQQVGSCTCVCEHSGTFTCYVKRASGHLCVNSYWDTGPTVSTIHFPMGNMQIKICKLTENKSRDWKILHILDPQRMIYVLAIISQQSSLFQMSTHLMFEIINTERNNIVTQWRLLYIQVHAWPHHDAEGLISRRWRDKPLGLLDSQLFYSALLLKDLTKKTNREPISEIQLTTP